MGIKKQGVFLDAADVMDVTGYGKEYALRVIRKMNKELEMKGYRVVRGRISRKYFFEQYGVDSD